MEEHGAEEAVVVAEVEEHGSAAVAVVEAEEHGAAAVVAAEVEERAVEVAEVRVVAVVEAEEAGTQVEAAEEEEEVAEETTGTAELVVAIAEEATLVLFGLCQYLLVVREAQLPITPLSGSTPASLCWFMFRFSIDSCKML